MPKTYLSTIYQIAEPQHGYLTVPQARAAGIRPQAVIDMYRRGVLERVSRAVYRLVNFPVFEHGQFMEAILWPQDDVHGVLSHESALVYHALSDANPTRVHISLPPTHRVRRTPPKHSVIHYENLGPHDVEIIEGIPVTTPVRSIIDAHASHIGPTLIRQAIDDGRQSGKLTNTQAEELAAHLFGKGV